MSRMTWKLRFPSVEVTRSSSSRGSVTRATVPAAEAVSRPQGHCRARPKKKAGSLRRAPLCSSRHASEFLTVRLVAKILLHNHFVEVGPNGRRNFLQNLATAEVARFSKPFLSC